MILITILIAATALLGQRVETRSSEGSETRAASTPKGRLISGTFVSESLKGNLLGDSHERSVSVYLPPGYDANGRTRYPVLYLLHGNGHTNRSWVSGRFQGMNIAETMDRLIGNSTVREMIVVMPEARNRHYGSHYVNSAVAGAWADFVVRDLVRYIDSTYRTLPSPRSRGIAGWSMGGRASLFLPMKYPGVFGAAYGLSSGSMGFEHTPPVTDDVWHRVLALQGSWRVDQKFAVPSELEEARAVSFATAFSPNPTKQPFFADLPVEVVGGKLTRLEAAWQQWLAHDPVALVPSLGGNLRQLAGLRFDCGTSDSLIEANRAMSRQLKAARVPHDFEEYDGTHDNNIRVRIETRVLPFFSRTLKR